MPPAIDQAAAAAMRLPLDSLYYPPAGDGGSTKMSQGKMIPLEKGGLAGLLNLRPLATLGAANVVMLFRQDVQRWHLHRRPHGVLIMNAQDERHFLALLAVAKVGAALA